MVDSIDPLINEISVTSDMVVGGTVLAFLAFVIYVIVKAIQIIDLQDW